MVVGVVRKHWILLIRRSVPPLKLSTMMALDTVKRGSLLFVAILGVFFMTGWIILAKPSDSQIPTESELDDSQCPIIQTLEIIRASVEATIITGLSYYGGRGEPRLCGFLGAPVSLISVVQGCETWHRAQSASSRAP